MSQMVVWGGLGGRGVVPDSSLTMKFDSVLNAVTSPLHISADSSFTRWFFSGFLQSAAQWL